MSDQAKTMIMGLTLMNLVGVDVLKASIDALGDQIR
jgi:hypothetical protein